MSLQELKKMFALFPTAYILFGVFDKNKLISTSVSIKVSEEILYCFYIGDDLTYRTYSPVTFLINGIYHYAKGNHFKILDLGLSTDKGILNRGLYAFKKTFGTIDSVKLTFIKQL
jgi:lipid II:glycine glycyltransferase (peptidoglycan interpeptide bridge formation enzyme)